MYSQLENTTLEEYNLLVYFRLLTFKKIITFPFLVTKSEAPDFVCQIGPTTVGIEVTHSVVENHFQNLKRLSVEPNGIVEICKNGVSYFRSAKEGYCCDPFYQDEAETLWMNFIRKSLEKKVSKFLSHYHHFERNILLIRDFTNLPLKSLPLAVQRLLTTFNGNLLEKFNEVTIILGDNCMIFDAFDKSILIKFDD
jgi:hypothetical protein